MQSTDSSNLFLLIVNQKRKGILKLLIHIEMINLDRTMIGLINFAQMAGTSNTLNMLQRDKRYSLVLTRALDKASFKCIRSNHV